MQTNFTIPQCPSVREIVNAFWQVDRQNNLLLKETIIPKGIVEIIFNFESTELYAQINGPSLTIPKGFIQGFHTHPVQQQLTGRQVFFGVVLNPAAVKHIFHFHPSEFTNCVIDLTLVDPTLLALWHRLGEQKTFTERVNIFTEWLMQRLPRLTEREQAFNNFLNEHGNTALSVKDVAGLFYYSSKQLSRKLRELTGMNTEQTLLYKKYLQAIHLMHYSPLSLTQIAYACHFSDQAHFIKTFRSLAMLTPKEYRYRKSDIKGHVLENVL